MCKNNNADQNIFFLFFFFLHSRDGKALERFLQDYFDGKLKRYMKSEPLPENNDGPVKVMATVYIIAFLAHATLNVTK